MAALCPSCKKQVPPKVSPCPHCGAKIGIPLFSAAGCVIMLVVVVVLVVIKFGVGC